MYEFVIPGNTELRRCLSMSENKHSRSGGRGYYIALILCAAAIGITGILYYRNVFADHLCRKASFRRRIQRKCANNKSKQEKYNRDGQKHTEKDASPSAFRFRFLRRHFLLPFRSSFLFFFSVVYSSTFSFILSQYREKSIEKSIYADFAFDLALGLEITQ